MKALALIYMAESEIDGDDRIHDHYFDALDTLPPSDLEVVSESEESHHPLSSLSSNLRRRSSAKFNRRKIPADDSNKSSFDSSPISEISQLSDAILVSPIERRNQILSSLKDHSRSESPKYEPNSDQSLPKKEPNCDPIDKPVAADPHLEDVDGFLVNFLVSVAGLVIKVIGFQISLFISVIIFPFWLLCCTYKLVTDPFRTAKRMRDHLYEKILRILSILWGVISPLVQEWLPNSQLFGKYTARVLLGCFWSLYVCFMLSCVLVLALVVGAITMRYFVEEPVQMKEVLNFDYTKANPVAFVPIVSCSGVNCNLVGCGENIEVGKRVFPLKHKLQVAVSLTLPESDYNRNLGIFQVRVEFLSANGKVSAALSHPCMLRFKSSPIHYFETFVKSGSLLAGYSSESQHLNLRMGSFTEGSEPTSCLRIILEHRAEFKPGSGSPEIYAASLTLESELPLLKRILWKWRLTIFIWTSMGFFIMQLLFILVCCRPVIIPRVNPRNGSSNRT